MSLLLALYIYIYIYTLLFRVQAFYIYIYICLIVLKAILFVMSYFHWKISCYFPVIFKENLHEETVSSRICLVALNWYQSIGYFLVLWYIEKSQTPKACSIDSLPQCKFVIWRSSSIWLQLFKYNSPFVEVGNNNLWPHEKETSTLRGERAVWTIIDHEINLHFFFAES